MCSVLFENDSVFLQVSEGLVLRDGTRLKYPINGIVEFWGGGLQYTFKSIRVNTS